MWRGRAWDGGLEGRDVKELAIVFGKHYVDWGLMDY